MSSSRSLASARTKRATGNTTIPGSTEQPDNATHAPTQSSVTKVSLPQAINRIGDRLNNLELFAETTTTVVDEIQEFHSNTSDKYIVDTDVFTSLVSRIEALERINSVKSGSNVSTTSSSSSSPSSVTNDITELRTHLIRLQTYVMETNAKLQDMVLSGNGASLVNFVDIFSDSHPIPSSVIHTPPVEKQGMEYEKVTEATNEVVVNEVDKNDSEPMIKSADNNSELSN